MTPTKAPNTNVSPKFFHKHNSYTTLQLLRPLPTAFQLLRRLPLGYMPGYIALLHRTMTSSHDGIITQ